MHSVVKCGGLAVAKCDSDFEGVCRVVVLGFTVHSGYHLVYKVRESFSCNFCGFSQIKVASCLSYLSASFLADNQMD